MTRFHSKSHWPKTSPVFAVRMAIRKMAKRLRFALLREVEKALPVKAWMNEGILHGLGERGYASEGSAEESRGATAVLLHQMRSTARKP